MLRYWCLAQEDDKPRKKQKVEGSSKSKQPGKRATPKKPEKTSTPKRAAKGSKAKKAPVSESSSGSEFEAVSHLSVCSSQGVKEI